MSRHTSRQTGAIALSIIAVMVVLVFIGFVVSGRRSRSSLSAHAEARKQEFAKLHESWESIIVSFTDELGFLESHTIENIPGEKVVCRTIIRMVRRLQENAMSIYRELESRGHEMSDYDVNQLAFSHTAKIQSCSEELLPLASQYPDAVIKYMPMLLQKFNAAIQGL